MNYLLCGFVHFSEILNMIVVVAWKNMYLNDNRVRVLVTRSVTLNQFLQLSEIFFCFSSEKGSYLPCLSHRGGCKDSVGQWAEKYTRNYRISSDTGVLLSFNVHNWKNKDEANFLLSKFTVVEKTYKHKYSQCFFVVHVLAARPFFFQSSFYTNLCKKEMFWLQEIHLARANCRITLNTPYRKKMKCVVDLY